MIAIKITNPIVRTCLFLAGSMMLGTTAIANDELLSVSVKPLSSLLIESTQSSPANVVSLNTSIVSSEITGRAFKIYAEAGDTVKARQRLVALDCRSYELAQKQQEASLKVYTARLNLAKKQLIRNQQLLSKGTIPRELYENSVASQQTSQADIELKKAQIESAKLAVDRCIIRAPFTAQISNKLVQQGQLLMPGTPLFELMQTNRLEIKAQLSPQDIVKLKALPLIEFVANDQRHKVKIRSVIQRVDETTRTQEVRLSLSKNAVIPAGLSGRVEWSNSNQQIPPEFILRNNGNLGVMTAVNTIEGGTAKAKFIALNNAIEGQPVESQLPKNTLIIDKNRYRVNNGQLLSIQTE